MSGNSKKILITGGLGYLGSVLSPYLEGEGYTCRVADIGHFRDCSLVPPEDPREILLKDARNLGEGDLKGAGAVVHLAGMSNDPFGNLSPEAVYDPTRRYALAIANLCKKLGMRFVFASSCSVYGKGEGVLNEDSPTDPQTPYSLNKLQIERDLARISDRNFSPIALRFATAFGFSPRMRFDIVLNMFSGMAFTGGKIVLNSDGSAWRPFIHVRDMCEAVRRALECDWNGGTPLILNVGDDRNNCRIREAAALVAETVSGCRVEFSGNGEGNSLHADRKIQDGVDCRTYRVSFGKIQKVFGGFSCVGSLQRGVEEMIAKWRVLPLTEKLFRDIRFYRLQRLDDLFQKGALAHG